MATPQTAATFVAPSSEADSTDKPKISPKRQMKLIKSQGQRKRSKKAKERSEKPAKKPLIINYDKHGNRIGPDGFLMTPARKRMHFLFNAVFVWGIVCLVASVACAVIAFGQGQTYVGKGLDITFVGGNMFHGIETAFLLRMEALIALFVTVMGPLVSINGFRWLYERRSFHATMALSGVLFAASLSYFGSALTMVGFIDPISAVSLLMVGAIWITMRSVAAERPALTKPKVAKTVTK